MDARGHRQPRRLYEGVRGHRLRVPRRRHRGALPPPAPVQEGQLRGHPEPDRGVQAAQGEEVCQLGHPVDPHARRGPRGGERGPDVDAQGRQVPGGLRGDEGDGGARAQRGMLRLVHGGDCCASPGVRPPRRALPPQPPQRRADQQAAGVRGGGQHHRRDLCGQLLPRSHHCRKAALPWKQVPRQVLCGDRWGAPVILGYA
mmetsp:Transcript_3695/g.8443  ORF Transcript_3695/g.8443 Transcript_3695/m.8443 type:complete len:201 (+) Transcript_3695:207-809(+)